MKNKSRKFMMALAALLILFAVNISFAQTARRIEFAKGANSATIKGTGRQSYVLHANAGQTIKIRLVSRGNKATLDFLDSAGSDLSEGSNGRALEITIDAAGEYRLNIQATGRLVFTLTVTVK